jgi:type IV pilus assembly protein PilW
MIKLHILSDNKGLTLVELMIVMVLSLLLMAAVYLSFQAQSGTSNEQHQVMALQQDLRVAMDIVERDILNMGYDPLFKNNPINMIFGIKGPLATSSTTTLESSVTGQITISFDLNANGTLDTNEQVAYSLNAGALKRDGNTLITNVSNLQFSYLDENDNLTTTIADIRSIQAQIDVQSPDGQFQRGLARRIKLRNVRIWE